MLCVWVYQVNLSALNPWKEGFVEQEYIFSAHIIQCTHCATYDILFKLPPPLGSKNGLVSQQNRIKSCVNGRLAAPHRNFSQVFFTCCFSIRERVLEKCYFSYLWDIEDRGLCGQRLCGQRLWGQTMHHICHFFSTYPIFYKKFLHAKTHKSRQNGSHKNSVKLTLWQKTG